MWYMVGNLGYVETTNISMYLHYTIPHLLATCKDSDTDENILVILSCKHI